MVIPSYGQPEFLLALLASYAEYDPGVKAQIIIVDDKSPHPGVLKTVYMYARKQGHRVIKNETNLGFAGTCNAGAAAGRAPYILLLNSDTLILHDGWLGKMVEEARNPLVGTVGALLTFFDKSTEFAPPDPKARPAGKVQHAGVVFDILKRPYHVFWGWSPDNPQVSTRREMNCVTGACLLTKRAIWEKIGGLDTDYAKGNFEDVQYCLQNRVLGYKVIFTPEAHLAHYGGGSGNSMTADRNAQLFQIKAGHIVEYDEWRHWSVS